MKKREQPKNGRKLLYIIAVLLGLMAGCAGPQLTSQQITEINVLCKDDATCIVERTDVAMKEMLEQLEYEREDRRIQARDECIIFLNACDASDSLVVVEVIKSGRTQLPNARQKRDARREYGYTYTHDNVGKYARKSDFVCMRPRDVMRQLGL